MVFNGFGCWESLPYQCSQNTHRKKKQKQTIAYLACTILAYGSWWYSFLFPFCVFLLVIFQICVDNPRQWCKLTIRRQYMYMYVFMVSNSVKWKCRQMTEHCSTQKRKKRQWISPFIWWQSLPTNCQLIPHCPHVRNCRQLAHQSPQYGHAKWRFFFCLFASYSISFFFFWFSAGASKNANQPKHDEIIFKIIKWFDYTFTNVCMQRAEISIALHYLLINVQ